MAEFTLANKPDNVTVITENVSESCTIYNRSGSVAIAGVVIVVHRGREIFQHIDGDTMVEFKSGETVTIDPAGVPNAIGVGVLTRRGQVQFTAEGTAVFAGNIQRSEEPSTEHKKKGRGKK